MITIKELDIIEQLICENTYPYFDKDGKPVTIFDCVNGYKSIEDYVKSSIIKPLQLKFDLL